MQKQISGFPSTQKTQYLKNVFTQSFNMWAHKNGLSSVLICVCLMNYWVTSVYKSIDLKKILLETYLQT